MTGNELNYEVCEYIAAQSSNFSFGPGNTNLKVGELVRGVPGVFVKESGSPQPDIYTPFEDHVIEFWAVYGNFKDAQDKLREVYYLFHQKHHYSTDSYYVYFSHALGQLDDFDRDSEGRRIYKLTIRFITRRTIS